MYTFGISSSVSTSELEHAADHDDAEARARRRARDRAPSASGMFPATTEKLVMMIGRNRVWALSLIAASLSAPPRAQRVRVVDEQNSVLRRDADQQDRPDQREQIEGAVVSTSAPIAPIAATGTEKMMMNGET